MAEIKLDKTYTGKKAVIIPDASGNDQLFARITFACAASVADQNASVNPKLSLPDIGLSNITMPESAVTKTVNGGLMTVDFLGMKKIVTISGGSSGEEDTPSTPTNPTGKLTGTGYGTGANGQTNLTTGEDMVVGSLGGAYIKVVFDGVVDGSGFTKVTLSPKNSIGDTGLQFGGGEYVKSGNAWNLTVGTGIFAGGKTAFATSPAGTGSASVEWSSEGGNTVASIRCNVVPENGFTYHRVVNIEGGYISTFDVTFE